MVEQVRIVEQSEYNLLNLHKSYRQYHKAVNELVSEEYWASISGDIVFEYDAATYTRDDLANMPQEEYDILKERMLQILRGAEMDKLSATVRISDVYAGSSSNQANIYTFEHKELKDQPFTATAKKYTLEKRSGEWLITKVEQDKFTYGSGQTAELREDGIKGLNYQAHDGKDIGYPTVIVLPGTSDSS
ncbi:hypothetical protein C173_26627 [Paenibacillus sp. FSL R7-277]|nr:hypothetical protein C173_26627 [Paenibacillus sp. FSL R7-277]